MKDPLPDDPPTASDAAISHRAQTEHDEFVPAAPSSEAQLGGKIQIACKAARLPTPNSQPGQSLRGGAEEAAAPLSKVWGLNMERGACVSLPKAKIWVPALVKLMRHANN